MSTGEDSEERRFGRKFADYLGRRCGTPVTNGSAALAIALEVAGVRYGDEVLVPGLAWVACASAVARIGAVPVLVDIDEDTYAMCPQAAAAAVSARTVAILVTHLSSSLADLDAFQELTDRRGLVLLEDCSQAHGAVWRGRRAGSYGRLAAFSFQSSKLLTAGEGGIVVTDGQDLDDQVQQLRSDGRRWRSGPSQIGLPDLEAVGERQGHNHCMTEIQAAMLSAGLEVLDEQNQARFAGVTYFEAQLAELDGIEVVRRRGDDRVVTPTFWHLPIRIDPAAFRGATAEMVRAWVTTDAGLFLEPVGAPMDQNPLYQPARYTCFPSSHVDRLAVGASLPGSRRLAEHCFTIPHHAFLASRRCLDRLVESFARAQEHAAGMP